MKILVCLTSSNYAYMHVPAYTNTKKYYPCSTNIIDEFIMGYNQPTMVINPMVIPNPPSVPQWTSPGEVGKSVYQKCSLQQMFTKRNILLDTQSFTLW